MGVNGMNLVDLQKKRILVTQADMFMGPVLCEVLAEYGAKVIADTGSLLTLNRITSLVQQAGPIDVLIANLAIPAPDTLAVEAIDEEWDTVFAHLVIPLSRLVRAVLPQMIGRKTGKIILMGSASALRGMKRRSTYSAARGAQLAYIQSVGVEVAPSNIQVNAIAQNLVENPTYFPPEIQALPAFKERIKWEMPLV